MSGMPWLKTHTSRLDDDRLDQVSDMAYAHYWKLYMLAGRLDAGGYFVENGRELTIEAIAFKAHIKDPVKLSASMKQLKRAKLVNVNGRGPYVIDFMNEQGPSQAEKREAWRLRQQRHRDGETPVTGDKSGVTGDRLNVTPPDQSQSKSKSKSKSKTTTTITSSSSKRSPSPGGGGAQAEKKKSLEQLTKKEQQNAKLLQPILQAAGLGGEKLKSTIVKVATRSKLSRTALRDSALAALASVYADDTIRNKPVVAASRLVEETVPPQFKSYEKWKCIPKEILDAAGINNLSALIAQSYGFQ